jgi:predicted peptidase
MDQIRSFTASVTLTGRYLLDLPPGFDPASKQRWPLVLFLHGAGERGEDIRLVRKHGPPRAFLRHKDS